MMKDHIKFLNQLKELVSNKYHGKIVYVSISGSDLYGFRSEDSDTDYRGSFMVKTNVLLGLFNQTETLEFETYKKNGEVENEAVLHELEKELNLVLVGNCNILENLFATPLLTSPIHKELQELALGYWNIKGIYGSYRGMAYENYKKFILNGKHTVKKYLYIIRALMSGIYALENNVIEPNIQKLNESYKNETVAELIDLKIRGQEKDPVNRMDRYDKVCDELFEKIDNVYEKVSASRISNYDYSGVSNWLKEKRIEYLDL
ncbi:MAG TPA: hypothetical protein ENI23_11945 [bacterium]|nr:hypothetical protein [bacterium]